MPKNVLVVGSGGREHALAWKLAQSPDIGKIFAAPGNSGMAEMGVECLSYKADDIQGLVGFAGDSNIDLTIVGPEDPLANGIVNEFGRYGLKAFGPSKTAAELEASKAFAKCLMRRHRIPTAEYITFTSPDDADAFIRKYWGGGKKWVVKASGLALGKGVTVCDTSEQAYEAIDRTMRKKEFGTAGDVVVIEERLFGPEASVIALCDESGEVFLPPVQDYKPVSDGDKGSNTGGMGAYSPVPVVTDDMMDVIGDKLISPTMEAMATTGRKFRGAAYAAVILTKDGPKILEYNVRFGDPETQPLMMRLRSDLLPYLEACTEDLVAYSKPLDIDGRAAVCVVLASGGYPGSYQKGKLITGLKDAKSILGPDGEVFHAGTKLGDDGSIYTNGGRVLGVTALGGTIDEAADLAYAAVGMIQFEGKQYRSDIGRNVMARGRVD